MESQKMRSMDPFHLCLRVLIYVDYIWTSLRPFGNIILLWFYNVQVHFQSPSCWNSAVGPGTPVGFKKHYTNRGLIPPVE